jgi:hypothetical protein
MPKFRQTPKKQPESSITALQFKEIGMALCVQPLKCEGLVDKTVIRFGRLDSHLLK